MIIPVRIEKSIPRINTEFASAVPEFAALLDDSKFGVSYLAYVIYVNDPAEDNLYSNIPEEIRKKEVADSLKLDSALLKDKKVTAAFAKYKMFCDQNISYQFKDSYIGGMQKVSEYVKGKKKLSDDDAKKFSDVLGEMPSLLKGKGELEKLGAKEQAKQGRVGADRKLSIQEKRLR